MNHRFGRCTASHIALTLVLIGSSLTVPTRSRAQVTPDRGAALERALRSPTEVALRSHVRFLSHDLFAGRGAGTPGGQLAAHYIAQQFEAAGLRGGAADGSYFQPVPLMGTRADATLIIGARRQTVPLAPERDFVAWPTRAQDNVTADGEVVFVGYGIRAPEWQWDDYGTSSLNGKILLMLAGLPESSDSGGVAAGKPTYYGTWNYKLDQAARMGAVGALIVHDAPDTPPWEALVGTFGGERVLRAGRAESNLQFAAWITRETARRIAQETGRDFDLLTRRAQLPRFQPITMGAHAVMRVRTAVVPRSAANVIAVAEGTDLVHEWVVFMAHYDHLGTGPLEQGDSIYNGAVHNATGVAWLLATAAAYASSSQTPRRSTLFLATSAADFGFLGARAFVDNPPVPLHQIAAVVNLDGGNVWGSTTDVVMPGAAQSELSRFAAAAAERESMTLAPEGRTDNVFFYSTDHVPFARSGVPVLTIRQGRKYVDREPGWGSEQEAGYLAHRYHRPADEFTSAFAFDGLLQQVRLAIRLGWMLGSTDAFPAWVPDAEFRAAGEPLRLRRIRDTRRPRDRR